VLVLLLSAFDASAGDVTPASYIEFVASFGVRSGSPAVVTDAGAPLRGELTVSIVRSDGWGTCTVRFDALIDGMSPVDTSAWAYLWSGAAWRLTLGDGVTSGACSGLDSTPWGADPAATVAGAGWTIGLGPVRPMQLFWGGNAADRDHLATVYAWMDGAEPYPIGVARPWEVDAAGARTGAVLDVSAATSAPDAWFESLQTGMML
jgi:hypothetical protein